MLHQWWDSIVYFSPNEFTYPGWMEEYFVRALDGFRQEVGSSCIISSSNDPEDNHSMNSEHYNNRAADVLFPTSQKPMLDILLIAMRYFNGVGIYPEWKYKGNVVGGFHLEVVPGRTRMKQWLAVYFDSGHNDYRAISEKELRNAGVI